MDSSAVSLRRIVWGLLLLCSFALGHSNHHHHESHQHQQSHHGLTARDNATLSDAASLVEQALATLAKVNKARVEQPSRNKYELMSDSELSTQSLAEPLDYSAKRRRELEEDGSSSNITTSVPYTIPSELVDAARIVAESQSQKPSGDHGKVAEAIRAKYSHKLNDTNVPSPLDRPGGLLGTFGPDGKNKRASTYWMSEMSQLGAAPFAPSGYKVS